MEHKPLVIGITGHPASGKDTVADYLRTIGFSKISLGDIIRRDMTALGIPIDRAHMSEFARKVREERGNGYLTEETVKAIAGDTVIAGVRNTEEVRIFKDRLGDRFKLMAIETPLEVRYARAQERKREGDLISFEQFKKEDEQERNSQSGSHEVDAVIALADVVLQNDKTMEDLFGEAREFVERVR